MKSSSQRAALTGAIFAALSMLVLSIANALGLYQGAATMMTQWHMFYNPETILGVISGMIEAAVITYVSVLVVIGICSGLGKKK